MKSLQGRQVQIPDLQSLFTDWPSYVNPELEHLRQDVDAKLQRYLHQKPQRLGDPILIQLLQSLFSEDDRLKKMKAADAALFGASWWPYASFETLKFATYLSIWVGVKHVFVYSTDISLAVRMG